MYMINMGLQMIEICAKLLPGFAGCSPSAVAVFFLPARNLFECLF